MNAKLVRERAYNDKYSVLDRDTGRKLGSVQKITRYYNLHPRPATYTYWRAYDVPGKQIGATDESTRRDAVQAVIRAHQQEGA